jgi:hypothetical protein
MCHFLLPPLPIRAQLTRSGAGGTVLVRWLSTALGRDSRAGVVVIRSLSCHLSLCCSFCCWDTQVGWLELTQHSWDSGDQCELRLEDRQVTVPSSTQGLGVGQGGELGRVGRASQWPLGHVQTQSSRAAMRPSSRPGDASPCSVFWQITPDLWVLSCEDYRFMP